MVIRYKKLIFVDTNDNCRAPMAEMILKRKSTYSIRSQQEPA